MLTCVTENATSTHSRPKCLQGKKMAKRAFSYCKKLVALGVALWMIGDMLMDAFQNRNYWNLSPELNHEHPMHASQNGTQQFLSLCKEFREAKFKDKTDQRVTEMERKCSSGD